MKYSVEMDSRAMIYIPSFIKIGSSIERLIGGVSQVADSGFETGRFRIQNVDILNFILHWFSITSNLRKSQDQLCLQSNRTLCRVDDPWFIQWKLCISLRRPTFVGNILIFTGPMIR
jgi:hypothetical protein